MAKTRTDQAPEQAVPGRIAGKFAPGHSGNPSGRARADASPTPAPAVEESQRETRFDGWLSLLTGLGTAARDRRESVSFCPDYISWGQAEKLWEGDDLAARIIETLPDEMIREGFDLQITDNDADDGQGPDADYTGEDPPDKPILVKMKAVARKPGADLKKEVEHQWEELGLLDALHKALTFEGAYGGAAILIGANDGSPSLETPLVPERVRGVNFLTVMEPREIQPVLWYGDPRAPKYNRPAVYQLTPSSPGNTIDRANAQATIRIHESRLIVFDGIRVTNRLHARNGGWGDSIMTRVYRVLRDFNLSWAAAGSLVVDFAQAVYKMKGLNDLLGDDPKDLFKTRMLGMNMARSVANVTMVDSEDEFTRIITPTQGLPDLLDRFTQRLAMAAGLPLPLLAGESPGGLNASGASGDQLRMFYDRAKSKQKRRLVPAIRRVTALIMMALGGEPAQWTIEPRPLWQPTQKEQIETRKIQSDIDIAMLDRSVVSAQEVREARYGGKAYSYETPLIENEDDAPMPTDDEIAEYAAQAGAKPGAVGVPAAKPGAAPMPAAGQPAPVAPSASSIKVAGPVGSSADIQKQAMNGAQTQAMMEVITAVVNKEMPIETAEIMLEVCFQLDPSDAQRMLAPTRNFEAPKPEPAPAAFGGAPGAPPAFGKPAAKPPIAKPDDQPDDQADE